MLHFSDTISFDYIPIAVNDNVRSVNYDDADAFGDALQYSPYIYYLSLIERKVAYVGRRY